MLWGTDLKKRIYCFSNFYFAHKKTLFLKYQHLFFNRFFQKHDFIYLWFGNVMVYGFFQSIFFKKLKKNILFIYGLLMLWYTDLKKMYLLLQYF